MAGAHALGRLATSAPVGGDVPALCRMVRDVVAAEILAAYVASRLDCELPADLADTTAERCR